MAPQLPEPELVPLAQDAERVLALDPGHLAPVGYPRGGAVLVHDERAQAVELDRPLAAVRQVDLVRVLGGGGGGAAVLEEQGWLLLLLVTFSLPLRPGRGGGGRLLLLRGGGHCALPEGEGGVERLRVVVLLVSGTVVVASRVGGEGAAGAARYTRAW